MGPTSDAARRKSAPADSSAPPGLASRAGRFGAAPVGAGTTGRPAAGVLLLVLAVVVNGCSVRSLAINALARSLVASGDVFAADGDPELIADATPFALKTIEALLAEKPRHPALLLAACRGFAQYAYAFVELEAERLEATDYAAARHGYERALGLYLRARDYGLRGLELDAPGIADRLRRDPSAAAALGGADVSLLFWTAAAWGGAISVGLDRPEIVVDWPVVRAMMERVLARDETFERGAVHQVMIALEGLPATMGGSPERARRHFERAVELSAGSSAGPYVTLAESVAVAEQDWREFRRLLEAALEVDVDAVPSRRLANVLAQRRARWLLDRGEALFLNWGESDESQTEAADG